MPAGRGGINPTTNSVGYTAKLVTVRSITADGKTALTVDRQSTQTEVPLLVQRSKGQLPSVGESWLITQDLGNWTFAAFVGGSGADFSSGDGTGFVVAATAPSDPADGTIWMDSASGNSLFQWDGLSWKPLPLGGQAIAPGSITGKQIAAGGLTGANLSETAGITASQVAFGAADIGGVNVLSGTSQPSGTPVGTLWVNPNDGNKISRWDGHVWVPILLGKGAIEPNSLDGTRLSEAAAIAPGQVNFTAKDIGGITTSISSIQPGHPSNGDLWYDATDGYALKQWSGSAWLLYQFGTSAIQAGSITAALIAAGTITAEQIAAGQIIAGIVDGTVISGAQFVAYGAAGEVLVYSGLPAPGNLIGSWSAAPGIDDFTNEYPAGLAIGAATSPQALLSQDANGAYITLPTNQADESQPAALYSLINNPGAANQQLALLIASMASDAAAADPNQWNILMQAGADDGSVPSSLSIFDGFDTPFMAMQNPGGNAPLLMIGQTPGNGAMQFMPVLLNGALLSYGSSAGGMVVQTWNKPGTYTWTVPAGVTVGKIEAIGPGGGGRFGDRNISIGGAGGEYSCEPTATLVPGSVATIVVGTGGAKGTFSNTLSSITNGKNGTVASSFTCSGTPTVTANPGQGGQAGTTRTPGATGSTNTIHHDGGASNGQFGNDQGGAGGGAAGSASGTGAAGITNTGRIPGTGGKGTGLAGSGGGGGWGTVSSAATTAGGNGSSPGGGGGTGGGGNTNAKGSNGGTGGNGLVRITYTNPGSPQIQSSFSSAPATDGSGNTIPAGYQGQVVAVNPSVSPSVPETFHTSPQIVLSTSPAYTNFAGRALEVKLNPDNTVTITGTLNIPSSGLSVGETIASVTGPYRPSRPQPVSAMALDASNNGQAVYLEMETTGSLDRFSVYNAGVTTLRINGRYPLDG